MSKGEFTVLFDNKSGDKAGKSVDKHSASSATTMSSTAAVTSSSSSSSPEDRATNSGIDGVIEYGKDFLGSPYLSPSLVMKYGPKKASDIVAKSSKSDKAAIDCSGFAHELMSYAGIAPSSRLTAEGMYGFYKNNGTVLKQPQKGALVFFEPVMKESADSGAWDAGRSITHVAMSLGGGKIMDSSGGRGVTQRPMPNSQKFKYHYIMPNYKTGGGSV